MGLWDAKEDGRLHLLAMPLQPPTLPEAGYQIPWACLREGLETILRSTETGKAVAWFSEAVDDLAAEPSGKTWAGEISDYLCLFTLEGA